MNEKTLPCTLLIMKDDPMAFIDIGLSPPKDTSERIEYCQQQHSILRAKHSNFKTPRRKTVKIDVERWLTVL